MNEKTYWGDSTAILRGWRTKTDVCIGQRADSGECAALCGTCFHILHADIKEDGEVEWYCSDTECNRRYIGITIATSSRYSAYQLEESGGERRFKRWVAAWTGIDESQLDILIEWSS